MGRFNLIKRVEHVEIWEGVSDRVSVFAVKFHPRRMRVVDTLAQAEALLERFIGESRLARAH